MTKKGQIVIFILLGLVMVTIAGILLYVSDTEVKLPKIISVDGIYRQLHSCNQQISIEAAYHLAKRGGYYALPEESLLIGKYNPLIVYNETIKNRLDIPEMEEEFKKYIRNNLPLCILNSIDSKYDVFFEEKEIEVEIQDNYSLINTQGVIEIKIGTTDILFESLQPVIVRTKLGKIHKMVDNFLNYTTNPQGLIQNPNTLPLGKFVGFDIKYNNISNNWVIVVQDQESSILSRSGIISEGGDIDFEYVFGIISDIQTIPSGLYAQIDNSGTYRQAKWICNDIQIIQEWGYCKTHDEWNRYMELKCPSIQSRDFLNPC